jgi:signal transduction histidine kinase
MSFFRRNIYLWTGLMFFIAYGIYSSVLDFSFSKNYFQQKLQTKIIEKQTRFDSVSREINSLSAYKQGETGIGFVTVKNDSVKSWSSNKLPAVDFTKLPNGKTSVRFLKNGVYLMTSKAAGQEKVVLFYRIKSVYPFENEYLKSRFNAELNFPQGIDIKMEKTDYPVFDADENVLAYLDFTEMPPSPAAAALLVFLLFAGYLSIAVYLIVLLQKKIDGNVSKLLIFGAFSLIWFVLLNYTGIFSFVRLSMIFQPESFALSGLLPSMISVFSIVVVVLMLLIAGLKWQKSESKKLKAADSFLLIFILALSFTFSLKMVKIVLLNTSSDIDLAKIVSLDLAGIFGLLTIVIAAVDFLIIVSLVINRFKASPEEPGYREAAFIAIALVPAFFLFGTGLTALINVLLLILIYIIILLILRGKPITKAGFYISMAVLISLAFNFNMNKINERKESEKRKILIKTLALSQDPEVEYLFGEVEKKIYNDSALVRLIDTRWDDNEAVSSYIIDRYFTGNKHWSRYDFQITLCDQNTNLLIKPANIEISCSDFFYNNLISNGHLTSSKNLYRLEYGSGQINYLGLFRFRFNTGRIYTVYLEINSKIKRKGFTKLLSPSGLDPFEKVRNYSIAKYEKGNLVENYGDFSYRFEENDSLPEGGMRFYNFDNYSHLFYKLNANELFVLSKPESNGFSETAPFAYLFLLMIVLTVLFLTAFNKPLDLWRPPQSFSYRLQMSFVLLLAFSLGVIAMISTIYIKELNHEKDARELKKTAFSLQTEFEHKLANTLNDGDDMKEYLTDLSNKFSKVFNTDINLYDLNGELLATTRPELFGYGLLSGKIAPQALVYLRDQKRSYLNLSESIGNLNYYSAYMPFHDGNNSVTAYLNLPYFARQDQLRKEVSSFVMTLMNVYTFMIVISILAILLLSNYIIRPLKMIKEMMRKIRVGKENEYIRWNRKDEIGELVEQYNRMVDELAESADILAKSERESAWRQMARQVAHEIKNPLTPMKLSVQYLLKAIDDGADDVEERIKNLSKTLIEQIDTLAEIATAFSDFAKMPINKKERFDLKEAIDASIKIFEDFENVEIKFIHTDRDFPVYADKQNLIRVFNNLIKNAVQSFSHTQSGFIDIEITDEGDRWKVSVRDNGSGIPEDEKDKIFNPNFTTKSSGMGLGLAMVRNIVINNGGTIEFESSEDRGTTFYLIFEKG